MLVLVGTGVAMGGVVVALLLMLSAKHPGDTAEIVGTVLAVLAAAIAIIRWLWSESDPAPTEEQDRHLDYLARALARQWRDEAHARGLATPAPVDLRWRLRECPDSPAVAHALTPPPAGIGPVEVPGAAVPTAAHLAGDHPMSELHGLHVGTPSGRLVVMGGEGTGKTSALLLLLLAAIRHRDSRPSTKQRHVPVPVLLTLASWSPATHTLEDFVVESLVRDHPFLRAGGRDGGDMVRQLLDHGRLALLLDGLDEMPEAARAAALRRIDQMSTIRTVVSSRAEAYDRAAARYPLHRSVVVELQPVSPNAAADYLLRLHETGDIDGWKAVAGELVENPTGALAEVLDTPLMLTLFKDAYPPGNDPGELLDGGKPPLEAAVERHLIDRMVRSAYDPTSSCAGSSAVGAGSRDQRQRRAEEWLERIAYRMPSHDLLWPVVGTWVPATTSRLIYGILFGPISAAAALLAVAPSTQPLEPAAVALAWGLGGVLTYIVAATIDQRVTRIPVAGMAFGIAGGGMIGLLAGLTLGLWLVARPAVGPTTGLAVGLAAGVGLGIALATTFVTVGMRNPRVAARRVWPAALGKGSIARPGAALTLAVAIAFVLLAALSESGSATLAVVVAAGGSSLGLVGDVIMATQGDSPRRAPASPEASLRGDLAVWTLFGVVFGTGKALIFGFIFHNGVLGGLGWFALSFAITLSSSHASGFVLALATLHVTRTGPFRLLAFLQDAQDRQVMRRVGWAYQFRHGRLQERLAERYVDRLDGSVGADRGRDLGLDLGTDHSAGAEVPRGRDLDLERDLVDER
jgi:hypothetical protein